MCIQGLFRKEFSFNWKKCHRAPGSEYICCSGVSGMIAPRCLLPPATGCPSLSPATQPCLAPGRPYLRRGDRGLSRQSQLPALACGLLVLPGLVPGAWGPVRTESALLAANGERFLLAEPGDRTGWGASGLCISGPKQLHTRGLSWHYAGLPVGALWAPTPLGSSVGDSGGRHSRRAVAGWLLVPAEIWAFWGRARL